MRIKVFFQGKQVIKYLNTNNDHNKIPKTFEILSTRIGCPECNSESLTNKYGYEPGVDTFCCMNECPHTIEVKSVLAEGSQKGGFSYDRPIKIKLGSPNTYKKINKDNKTLMVFWYNIIFQDDKITLIDIKHCVSVLMSELIVGINCTVSIVLQKRRTKYKERKSIEIFPESCKLKIFNVSDFCYKPSFYRNRSVETYWMINKLIKSNSYKQIKSKHTSKHTSKK